MSYLLKKRYRTIKPIGQGGFGKTFLAVDDNQTSKTPCVIKQFSPSSQGMNSLEKSEALFNKEAERLKILGQHSQIPELLDHFEEDEQLYLIQEYIDGQNLAEDLAENGVWDETAIKELLIGLLSVLQFVHDNNLIHRDIKPENIIQKHNDKTFVLVDFGAARYVTGTALLKTGTIIGDPRYMSDEQLRGKAVFSSDLYSLGLTCLHLLTNIAPWDLYDGNEGEFIWRDYLTEPINEELGEILDKMIEKPIKKRFQNAQEILSILQPVQAPIKPKEEENKETKTSIQVYKSVINKPNEVINIELKPIKLGGSWGYINTMGEVVIEPQFEEAETFIDGLAKVKVNGTYSYIDQSGTIIIKTEFNEIGEFIDGLAKVKVNEKYGYVNEEFDIVINPWFDRMGNFSEGLAVIVIVDSPGAKYGFIDKTGKIIIEPKFADASDFSDGLAMIGIGPSHRHKKYGFIDKTGKIIIEPKFERISFFSDGLAVIRYSEYGPDGYIDQKDNIVIEPQFKKAEDFKNGKAYVEKKGFFGLRKGYIDKTGKWIK